MARYFEGSLAELCARVPKLTTDFETVDNRHFIATVYVNGRRAAHATLWRASGGFGFGDIVYSTGAALSDTSANDWLTAKDDGYTLFFEAGGLGWPTKSDQRQLSVEGAAEYMWARFIELLQ
jgi:hypothetical protein